MTALVVFVYYTVWALFLVCCSAAAVWLRHFPPGSPGPKLTTVSRLTNSHSSTLNRLYTRSSLLENGQSGCPLRSSCSASLASGSSLPKSP